MQRPYFIQGFLTSIQNIVFYPICPYIPPYTLYWQVNNGQSKLLTRMHPPPACFLSPHPISLPDFSCTFALLIRIPLKILHQLPLSALLPPAHLLLSGSMRTPVKLPISKQLHLLRIEGLSLLARGIFVVLLVKSMERDGLQLGLQDLYAPGLTSSQSLRLLPLRLGFVTGIQLQALLIVEDQCLEGHLGSGLVGLVEDDGPTVLQTHPNNFISLSSQNISRGDTPVVYYTYSPTPIIFSRPLLYNKIKMRREKHLLGMALLIVLVVMGSCETMGNSPYPSYSQVAAIGNGPDMSALGVGSVGIGAESNNTASLPYDSKALDDLSRMINELLASMNSTDPPSNPSSPPIQDNGSSERDTPATPNTPPPQNTPTPTTNKPDVKPNSSPRPATTGTSSSQSGNTKSGSASGSTGTTSSVNTSGSNKGGASVSSPSSTSIPSSSSSSVKSSDNSGKTTSSSQATTTSSATITTSNKNTQTTTTTTSSSTNKNSNPKPISTPPSTSPPATTTPVTPPPASDPTPSTSDTPATPTKQNSSTPSSTDPLFSFQDYLSTIFSPVNTDSATKSTSGDLNFGYSDGNTPVSDGSATSSDSTNANTDTSTSADTNTDTNSQAQTQTQTAPPPKDPPAAPTPAPASTNTKSTNTKKTDTKTSPTQITTSNLSTTPPSSPPSSSPPSSSSPSSTDTSPPPSSSRPSGLCVSDEQCRNDYGSFVADGLTLSCSPTLGVCTYS